MTVTQTKWLLRIVVPAGGVLISMLCGKTAVGALGVLLLTTLFILVATASPLFVIGIVFAPVLALYGIKVFDRSDPELDLRDPDTKLFLSLGIPATWVTIGLLSFFPRS